MIKTPGLPLLPKNDILQFLNTRENFIGLGKSTNASMQNNTFIDWEGHSKLGPVPDSIRQDMIDKEMRARSILFNNINTKMNNGN